MKALSCFRKEIAMKLFFKKVGDHVPKIISGLEDNKRSSVLVFRHETYCGAIFIVEFSKDDDYPDKLWEQLDMRYQTLFVSNCSQSGVHYGMLAPSYLNLKCPDYEKAWELFRASQSNPELDENLFEALAPLMGGEEKKIVCNSCGK